MPTISCGFQEVPERSRRTLLTDLGPTIDVQIGHDPGFEDFTNEKPRIPPDLYPALVDTGASGNSVDTQLAAQLRLPVYEYNVLISGSVGEHTTNIYLAQIYIPGLNRAISGRFTGVNLADGGQFQRAIIGRSFLQDFVLRYDGRTGEVALSDE